MQSGEGNRAIGGDAAAEQKVSPRVASGQSTRPGRAAFPDEDHVSGQRERRRDLRAEPRLIHTTASTRLLLTRLRIPS